ncbi:MAG: MtrB/PioB family outer membrane beta-barrel protein [Geobacteraceae bacterium]|nr:MtrB/PioB family outer membrane beta-barrel protein [Geobacteraceae bacterium]
MKQSQLWLLALLSILTFMTASSVMAAEDGARVSGSWELGMSGINTDDNAARVNEYGSVRAEDGIALAPKLDLEFKNGDFLLEAKSETMGPRDQMHEIGIDAGRVFRLESSLNVLEHHKDHETLNQMGATGRSDIGKSQPSVTTDKIFSQYPDGTAIGGGKINMTAAEAEEAWSQEADNDYIVTRREWKNEAELVIPQLANITFKAGARIETREGMEQAIGLSKCDSCHVSATGKEIDERTEEFTLGATGKFGVLTVDYEYLTRDFDEDASAPTRFYDEMGNSSAPDQMLYPFDGNNVLDFANTPDSEKETHMLKARVDMPSNTSLTASYVKSDVESSKSSAVQDGYVLQDGNDLESEFESYAGKFATKFGKNVNLSLRGKIYEIDVDENRLYFESREGSMYPKDATEAYHSAEARQVTEFGADLVYRLAMATTLRLGYEYEEVDRDEEFLGETETHTFKAALKSRLSKTLSGRVSYEYQDINEPFAGAEVGIVQLTGEDGGGGLKFVDTWEFQNGGLGDDGNKTLYWTDVYPNRELESTNMPEDVHEAKFSTTWSPASNMAATIYARMRYEENNRVKFERMTITRTRKTAPVLAGTMAERTMFLRPSLGRYAALQNTNHLFTPCP